MQVAELHAGEVRADPLAGSRHVLLAAVNFDPPDAHGPARRQQLELLISPERSGHETARHDRTETRNEKCAIDRQADRPRLALFPAHARGDSRQRGPEKVQTLAGHGRYGNDRSAVEKGAAHEIAHVREGDVDEVAAGAVALRHRDHAVRQAEQPHDLEVLARLGHDGLVGGDDEEHRFDPARAGQHVANELLVARHVHERDAHAVPLGVRESQIDRDAAPLLLGEPVGVDAGQSPDQRGLPVVDVPGRPDEEALHGRRLSRPAF